MLYATGSDAMSDPVLFNSADPGLAPRWVGHRSHRCPDADLRTVTCACTSRSWRGFCGAPSRARPRASSAHAYARPRPDATRHSGLACHTGTSWHFGSTSRPRHRSSPVLGLEATCHTARPCLAKPLLRGGVHARSGLSLGVGTMGAWIGSSGWRRCGSSSLHARSRRPARVRCCSRRCTPSRTSGRTRGSWHDLPDAEVNEIVADRQRLQNRGAAGLSEAVAAQDARGAWAADEAASGTGWLKWRCRMKHGVAAGEIAGRVRCGTCPRRWRRCRTGASRSSTSGC